MAIKLIFINKENMETFIGEKMRSLLVIILCGLSIVYLNYEKQIIDFLVYEVGNSPRFKINDCVKNKINGDIRQVWRIYNGDYHTTYNDGFTFGYPIPIHKQNNFIKVNCSELK